MLLIHEGLLREAEAAACAIRRVFGFSTNVRASRILDTLEEIPEIGGYRADTTLLKVVIRGDDRCLALIDKPLFSPSKTNPTTEDWWFASASDGFALLSTNRLGPVDFGEDSQYLRRLTTLAVHEVGHSLVHGLHMRDAWYVNAATNERDGLGLHCTDPCCVMYEVIDVKTPDAQKGYLMLGAEQRYDAGLDDLIARMHADWLCTNCRAPL